MYIDIKESNEHTAILSPLLENRTQRIVFRCSVMMDYFGLIINEILSLSIHDLHSTSIMLLPCLNPPLLIRSIEDAWFNLSSYQSTDHTRLLLLLFNVVVCSIIINTKTIIFWRIHTKILLSVFISKIIIYCFNRPIHQSFYYHYSSKSKQIISLFYHF